jgi:hypothetical protein
MLIAVPFVIVVVVLAPLIARSLPFVDVNRQVLLRDRYVVPVERSQDLNPLTGVAAADGGTTIRYRVTTDAAVSARRALRRRSWTVRRGAMAQRHGIRDRRGAVADGDRHARQDQDGPSGLRGRQA